MSTNSTQGTAEQTSPSSPWNRLGVPAGLLIAAFAGILFAVGRQNRAAFLYQLGLDIYQVPDDFNGYALGGFGTITNLAILWLIGTAGAFFVIAAITWWLPPIWGRAKQRWPLLSRAARWVSESPETTPRAHGRHAAIAIMALGSIYFVWLTRFILNQAQEAGTSRGERFITALSSDRENETKSNTHWIQLSFPGPRPIEEGYRLLCTEKICSIYQPDVKMVSVVPLEGLTAMRVLDERPRSQSLSP